MQSLFLILVVAFGVEGLSLNAWAKTVQYSLVARRERVNLSGKQAVDWALTFNHSIPAPTLTFEEGDEAEVTVQNEIPDEEVSVHWHGLLLPNEMDGVPYVTTPPIPPGKSFIFRFPIRHSGTYWYHSHTQLQEQRGLYGAIVIHPKSKTHSTLPEEVVVLSDWSDERGDQILKNLRKDGDYYLYKKGTVRSWWGALSAGKLGSFLYNEWTRMGGMDLSDVGYDAFLVNGKRELALATRAAPGSRVKLRVINAAASSYFYVSAGKQPFEVVAADGTAVQPFQTRELILGMAETYDIVVTLPATGRLEFKATAQDGTGFTTALLGEDRGGEVERVPVREPPDLYATMDHSAHHSMGHSAGSDSEHSHASAEHSHASAEHSHASAEHSHASSHSVAAEGHAGHTPPLVLFEGTAGVDQLKALDAVASHATGRQLEVKLVLGGDMRRYVWHLNGKTISEEQNVVVDQGDRVRLTFENQTMMHHPMHLHGHFFRVITAAGEFSPLKHTVDVPPHSTRVIEFEATEPGLWMLHCHNLYHLKNGMARIVKYSTFTPTASVQMHQKHDPHLHDHGYFYGQAELATHHAQFMGRYSTTWNELEGRVETRSHASRFFSFKDPWEWEADLLARRWFGQYFSVVGGALLFDRKGSAAVGVQGILPFLIHAQAMVNHRAEFRVSIEKRFQWTTWLLSDVHLTWRPRQGVILGKDIEFEVTAMVAPVWAWSAGLMVTENNVGVGIQYQF